ncbi:YciI family protein, partial [Mesorhizobium sp. M1A.F.Ca.IN.020.06.1.1]
MRYMLLIYNDEAAMANAPRDKTEQTLAAYSAYTE